MTLSGTAILTKIRKFPQFGGSESHTYNPSQSTVKGLCRANLHKWGLTQSPSCDCGQRQTANHTVDTCPLTKFEGGLNLHHGANDDGVIWLESTETAALIK